MTRSTRPTSPQRILVRVPTWVGDAVLATPALRALRLAHPRAEITVEGRPVLAQLLEGLPLFDRFLPDPERGPRGVLARTGRLRAGRFDWAVLLPDSVRAALGPFLARIPRRVGYSRDPLRRRLLTEALAPPQERGRRRPIPMVERYLRVTRQLGCSDGDPELSLTVAPGALARVEADLTERGVAPDEGLLVVTPGAGFGPSKCWPPEHFAAACDRISSRLGLRAVLAPAAHEVTLARRIAAHAREPLVSRIDPPVDLTELKALIFRAQLVLTNDTGPRHIAAAFGRPAVVVMGPTDPRHTASHLERQRVLREDVACSPCQLANCPIDHRCMTQLAPSRVLAAAQELLRDD